MSNHLSSFFSLVVFLKILGLHIKPLKILQCCIVAYIQITQRVALQFMEIHLKVSYLLMVSYYKYHHKPLKLLQINTLASRWVNSKIYTNIIYTFPPIRKSSARSWNCPWISPQIVTGLFTGCSIRNKQNQSKVRIHWSSHNISNSNQN